MGVKKADRRVCRTRRSLSDALVGLILEKRYDAITVQNLIDRADVGRSTFYAHYRDKEDLFLTDWKRLLDAFVGRVDWDGVGRGRFFPLRDLLGHAREFHHFYMALARSRKTEWLFRTGQRHLTESVEKSLGSWLAGRPRPSVPVTVLSGYVAREIMAQTKWWLDRNMPCTPERMDEIFHELVVPGLRSALKCDEAGRAETGPAG